MTRGLGAGIVLIALLFASAQAYTLSDEDVALAHNHHRGRAPRHPHSEPGKSAPEEPSANSPRNCVALPGGADAVAPYNPTLGFTGLQFYTDVLKENAHPIVDPAAFPMRLPGGTSGPIMSVEQIAGLLKERAFVFPTTLDQQTRANEACRAVNASGDCITSLQAFESVWYSALSPKYRPEMAAFPFSDAAFARMRLTVDPLVIAAVKELPKGVDASEVNKFIDANCRKTFPQLLRNGQVFAADYRPLAPFVEAPANTSLQLPVVLFVVDGGEFKVVSITLSNSITYTPMDDPLDWLLAKAYTNALSTSDIAAVHFINNHFVLENLCISAERNFYPKHPLAVLLKIPCKLNAGIIDSGVQLLLPPGSIFDTILAVSSNSLSTKLLPYLANTYNWKANYLSQSLSSRDVTDIPGFAYVQDAGALYGAFFRYACAYLNGVYDGPRALAMDDQLAKFLGDVSGGGPAAIGGFPESSAVLEDVESLAEVVAQVMWLAAVHHTFNSDKVLDYDAVLPSNPGRVWAAPPDTKGTLTEAELINTYLLPPVLPDGKKADWLLNKNIFLGVSFSLDPDLAEQPKGVVRAAYAIEPLIPPGCPGSREAALAARQLNEELFELSRAIGRRERELAGTVAPYYLLDPKQLPSWTMI